MRKTCFRACEDFYMSTTFTQTRKCCTRTSGNLEWKIRGLTFCTLENELQRKTKTIY